MPSNYISVVFLNFFLSSDGKVRHVIEKLKIHRQNSEPRYFMSNELITLIHNVHRDVHDVLLKVQRCNSTQ